MASSPFNRMYSEARSAEMLRQARQSRLAREVGASRDYERRSFLRLAWLSRRREVEEIPEAPPVPTSL
jgi:hypothetical protein